MKKNIWPNGHSFAFTIVDDTDNSTIENIKPVYELLKECGILSTKTLWVYPSRDGIFTGDCLQDKKYLSFVKGLHKEGFELGSHGVGSGSFNRKEIISGFNLYFKLIGQYPKVHANHAGNPDLIYWGYERFVHPLRWLYRLKQNENYLGSHKDSPYFWGDISKKHIQYMRNRVINDINTTRFDKYMPYKEKNKSEYSNYWFSSSDGHTVEEFNDLLSEKNIQRLEKEGGACIVYTHFSSGFVDADGSINEQFKETIQRISKKNGWFVPASTLLDYLIKEKQRGRYLSYFQALCLDVLWLYDRVIKKIKYNR